MSLLQHDGASDEGEKRNGNGSQDRWHQRPGSGAWLGRRSGSLRHDCAAHCSHYHNGDQGGAPHCCQSRSHSADDEEIKTHTQANGAMLCLLAFLQTCLFQRHLSLLDRLATVAREEKKDREPASKRCSGEDARKRGFVQWETVQVHHALFVHYGQQLWKVFLPARSEFSLSLRPAARPPSALTRISPSRADCPFLFLPPERP